MRTGIPILPALLGLMIAGCARPWTVQQIRSHLQSDFHKAMTRDEVVSVLEDYPTSGGPYSGSWPSRDEWYEQFRASYEPHTMPAFMEAHLQREWNGPNVITASMRYAGAPFISLGTWDPPGPNMIWFELTDEGLLTQWGHTYGHEVVTFPTHSSQEPDLE